MLTTENKKMLVLFGIIVTTLLVILAAILWLEIPAVPVCVLVLLEAGIIACLHDVPIWVHGLAIALQIVAGALTANLIFMLLCSVMYVVGILALKFYRE